MPAQTGGAFGGGGVAENEMDFPTVEDPMESEIREDDKYG